MLIKFSCVGKMMVLGLCLSSCFGGTRGVVTSSTGSHTESNADTPTIIDPASPSLPGADGFPSAGQNADAANADQSQVAVREAAKARATIYAIDQQTYRFDMDERQVWDAMVNVLLRNYNFSVVDRSSGIITTEWDSYYVDDGVFRNKLTIRLAKYGKKSVDVYVRNTVERLADGVAAGTLGAVWLPSEGADAEVRRVVQNTALVLNQPPPIMPPGEVAASPAGEKPVEPLVR